MAKTELAFDIIARDKASATLKDVGNELDSTGRKGEGFASKFGGLGRAMPIIGAAVAGAAVGVIKLGGAFIETSSDMEAIRAKSQTVFGDSLPIVQEWASKSANAMKLTRSEATGLATNFADLLVPMGFTRDAAATVSTEVIGLSGALSKWSGGQRSAAEVADILSGAMLGEYDALKGLGIGLSAAEVQSVLAAKGQDKLTGAALQQAQALAVQELIMQKSTDAQAAYAAGGGTLRDKMELLRTKLREVWETLVERLTPSMTAFADWLQTQGIAKLQEFGGWLSKNRQNFIDMGISALEGAATILRGIAMMVNGASTGFGAILTAATVAFGWVPGVGGRLREAKDAFDGMKDTAVGALNAAANQADRLAGKLDGLTRTRTVTINYQQVGSITSVPYKARALGGPVTARTPYLVGERGPELFTPSSTGRITTAADTSRLLNGGDDSLLAALGAMVRSNERVEAALERLPRVQRQVARQVFP